jgi:arylsulfatase A-like enzyme
VIVFTADHGEEFHDHGGLEHGYTLYDEQLHVPLIVRLPGGAGGGHRHTGLVRTIDVAPTLLALATLRPDDDATGAPLLTSDGSIVARAPEQAFADTEFGRRLVSAVVIPPWKVILPPPSGKSSPEVYDLAVDPRESHNLAAERPTLVGFARQELAAAHHHVIRFSAATAEPTVAPEVLERLRQLGYAVE